MTTGTRKKKITYYILTWGSDIITMQIPPTTSGQRSGNNNNYQNPIHQHGTLNDGIVVVVAGDHPQLNSLIDCLLACLFVPFALVHEKKGKPRPNSYVLTMYMNLYTIHLISIKTLTLIRYLHVN
jgi:hypothetical protein